MYGALPRRAVWCIAALALLLGGTRAWQLGWICDDAFISLRYAQNLVAGAGLVFNPGEYVEGYTNLSWTLLLAAALALGLPDLQSAAALGLASYAALAGMLLAHTRRRARETGRFPLPLAALAVLGMDDFHVWATGGLETCLFSALATGGLLRLQRRDRSNSDLEAGLIFSALLLTRPDGVIFAAVGVAAQLLRAPACPAAWRAAARTALPVAVTLVLWAAFKLAYYEELFPTAFYSKSALGSWWSQGALYLRLFLIKNWALGLAALGAAALLAHALRQRADAAGNIAALLAGGLVFALYVVRVGGDFMFARRLLPAVPLLLLACEEGLLQLRGERLRLAASAAVWIGLAFPGSVYRHGELRIQGIADERRFYPPETVALRKRQGEALQRALSGTDARVAFEGGLCMLAYYSRLPYLVELTGLTQYSLAKRPLEQRGFVGHEKAADPQWFAENQIDLLVRARSPLNDPAPRRIHEIFFEDVTRATILRWRDALLRPLAALPDVELTPIEAVIASSRSRIEAAPSRELAQQILDELHRYYPDDSNAGAASRLRELHALVAEKPARSLPVPKSP